MTAKSYTQVSTYETCPAKFSFRYRDRIKSSRPKSPAAERGTLIHGSIENFMLNKAEHVHPEVTDYEDWLTDLKDGDAVPEFKWALNDMWEVVDYGAENAYIRGFIDLMYRDEDGVTGYEFKTGKRYPDHKAQVHLYSIAARIHYDVDFITVVTVYLDEMDNHTVTYEHSMATDKYLWSSRIDKLDRDPYYAPRPGPYCRWCDFAKGVGGPCQFGG